MHKIYSCLNGFLIFDFYVTSCGETVGSGYGDNIISNYRVSYGYGDCNSYLGFGETIREILGSGVDYGLRNGDGRSGAYYSEGKYLDDEFIFEDVF